MRLLTKQKKHSECKHENYLQISMVDSLTMAIFHTINKLLEVSPRFSFTKTFLMSYFIKQFTTSNVLQNYIYLSLARQNLMESNNMRMPNKFHNRYLHLNLIDHFVLDDGVAIEYFHGDTLAGFGVLCELDLGVCSFTDGSPDFILTYSPDNHLSATSLI